MQISTQMMNSLEMNDEQKLDIILSNIIKMLIERNVINKDNYEKIKQYVLSQQNDENIYEIPLDDNKKEYGKNIYLNFINQSITTFSKNSNIYAYLSNNTNKYVILIVNSITQKSEDGIKNKFNNVEVFEKNYFMINLIEHDIVPKHILLTSKEAEDIMTEYNVTKRQMKKIEIIDPVSKYYNAKKGMIFKIYEYSVLAGYNISYRYCINP